MGTLSKLALVTATSFTLGVVGAIAGAPVPWVSTPAPAADTYWQAQHYQDCALMASADLIAAVKGGPAPTESEMEDAAATLAPGMYDRQDGTDMTKVPVFLKHYGLRTDLVQMLDLTTLREAVKVHPVIVVLNGYQIWTAAGVDDSADTDHTTPNHAVVVERITDTSVVLVDSATMPREVVPVSVFLSSWATSDHGALVVE